MRPAEYISKNNMIKKNFVVNILLLTFISSTYAQLDSTVNKFQQQFDQFRQNIEQQHRQFKNKNDSIFTRFLKDSWREFDVFYNEIQEPPKPVLQPKFKTEKKPIPQEISPAPPDSAESHFLSPKKIPVKPSEKSGKAMLDFDFYGIKTTVINPGNLPPMEIISAKNIESYFKAICNLPAISELVQEFIKTKNKLRLNDWGYYKMVEQFACKAEATTYRQTLFTWAILLKSGYNVKTGFTDQDIYLMLPSYQEFFSVYYLTVDNIPYYIQTKQRKSDPLPRLRVHKANYPGNNKFSMYLTEIPLIGIYNVKKELIFKGDTIKFNQNKWLASFYNDYPHCDMNVYFSAPISNEITQPLENYFNPQFSGKTDIEKVTMLLAFVQNAFAYKTDMDQFGREKYFFPDEVFYYPFSDCEDRSILFSHMVKYFTDCECIGLNFPGHVNTAVHFKEKMEGSFIHYDNKNYLVCDPTYVNAPIGYLDSKYEKFQPKIIIPE